MNLLRNYVHFIFISVGEQSCDHHHRNHRLCEFRIHKLLFECCANCMWCDVNGRTRRNVSTHTRVYWKEKIIFRGVERAVHWIIMLCNLLVVLVRLIHRHRRRSHRRTFECIKKTTKVSHILMKICLKFLGYFRIETSKLKFQSQTFLT